MKIDPCWNKIGAWGSGECPELATTAHCRNCPVYSRAAADVLDRELPEGALEAAARSVAAAGQTRERGSRSAVVFRVGPEWLALATEVFKEVCELRCVHSLPHQRNGVVMGIANVRGELLVVVSLAALFGITKSGTPAPADGRVRERLLVAGGQQGERLVFRVDEVHGIHRYDPGELSEAPATIAKAASTYTRAIIPWQQKAVGLLDHELLFDSLNRSLS